MNKPRESAQSSIQAYFPTGRGEDALAFLLALAIAVVLALLT